MVKKYSLLMIIIFSIFLVSCTNEISKTQYEIIDDADDVVTTDNNDEIDSAIDISNIPEFDFAEANVYDYKSIFYRNNTNIDFDEIALDENKTYVLNDSYLDCIEISEIILEPIKISVDYRTDANKLNFSMDSLGLIKINISEDIYSVASKFIPINDVLKLGQSIDIPVEIKENEKASLWFYPICYKINYADYEYRVLKIANKLTDNLFIPVSDGIFELRVSH